MNHLYGKLEALEPFEAAEIKKTIKEVQKETGIKGKQLFMPIRVAVLMLLIYHINDSSIQVLVLR